MTTTTARPNLKYRPRVELSADLVERMGEHAERNGTTVAELYFHWLITAGRMVCQGRGHLLPQVPMYGSQRRLARGTLGPIRVVRWAQSKQEYDRCASLVDAAGSSVPAVLLAAAKACDAAQGDLLRMEWPPHS